VLQAKVSKQLSESTTQRVNTFIERTKLGRDSQALEEFLMLIMDVNKEASSEGSAKDESSVRGDTEPQVDNNICCFASGKLYTESMLGVGVSRQRKNLGTAAELLSKNAFDGGLRQNTDKSAFEFFLPVWINERHASNSPAWCKALQKSYTQMGSQVFQVSKEEDCILEVFPRLINQMIVEVMRPDASKSAAITIFEALCNFWRTLRWLVDSQKPLLRKISDMLQRFVADEPYRHKDVTADLGIILVLHTVVQGQPGCPCKTDFIDSYFDENSLRCVMWWQRSGTRPESQPVFDATKVSREICMFQMMVLDVVIADPAQTLKQMEATNCKLPSRLESLQSKWKQTQANVKDWRAFFKCIQATEPKFPSSAAWIASCVQRAASKGPKYGDSGKGSSKGAGKGKGKGKGKY